MSSVFLAGTDAVGLPDDLFTAEPTLDEIFTDPLVGLILRRDRLTVDSVRTQLDRERRRLAARSAPVLRRAA